MDIALDGTIHSFKVKPQGDGNWINGGFMVCEPEVFDFISDIGSQVVFEKDPLENLAEDGKLNAYKHEGFWYPMDTVHGKNELTQLWLTGQAPWALWLNKGEKK